MAAAAAVQVVGLRALFRDLNRMSDPRAGELTRAMAAAGRAAAEPVAEAVRSAYPSISGRLAGTVRVTGSRSGAAVRVGRKTVPYAGPVDFGGWPEGRPYVADGRYLYPAMRAHQPQAVAAYERAVAQVTGAYPWTNTGGNPHD
jgi:hypothetical protein